jgi:glycerol-3-phosphate acyltransferase PlsY
MIESTLLLIAAYLLGSVSFAIIVARLYGLPDPRSHGSGNPAQPTCCAPARNRPPH